MRAALGLFLPLVLSGLHQGLVPIHVELVQAHGSNPLLPILAMAGVGQVGAALAVLLKTRNARLKKVIKGALPVGILGIGEPLILVTLPLGRPFIGACLGGAVGGALISYWKVATVITFGISGLPLALTIVSGKVMLYLAGMLITIIAGFFTWMMGFNDPEEAFERQAATTGRRGAPRGLFDLDGTLHQEDMFGSFLRFAAPLTAEPVAGDTAAAADRSGALLLGRAARWPMSLLLWAITFGRSEAKSKRRWSAVYRGFRQKVTAFPVVKCGCGSTGGARCRSVVDYRSPERLVEQVYRDSAFLPRVRLDGSRITRRRVAAVGPCAALSSSGAGAAARCAAEAVQRCHSEQQAG